MRNSGKTSGIKVHSEAEANFIELQKVKLPGPARQHDATRTEKRRAANKAAKASRKKNRKKK